MTNHRTSARFSAEVRERAVRMVFEHRAVHASQWAAIASIAVSPEVAPDSVDNSSVGGDPTFPVLVDHGGKIAEQFGLSFEMGDAAKNVLKGSGFNLKKRNADGRWILPIPGTFVINRAGQVAYAHVDPDYRNRPKPQEIVAMCRSLQRQPVSHQPGPQSD